MKILYLIFSPILFLLTLLNFLIFKITGFQTLFSHRVFRKAFIASSGRINDFISFLISKFSVRMSLKELNRLKSNKTNWLKEKETFKNSMSNHGFYVFNEKMQKEELYLMQKSLEKMDLYFYDLKDNKQKILVNESDLLKSNKYSRQKDDLINSKTIRDWALSKEIVTLAQEYLKSKPYCDLLASWISLPTKNEQMLSKAAQKFHFDMDRIKFIKFFVYLTDVSEINGPHNYIKSSHKKLPYGLKQDGRISDEKILNYFGHDNSIKITGPAGTIIAVDTRGFHKGTQLIEGKRDILQVEFSNSPFGLQFLKSKNSINELNRNEKEVLKYF